MLDFLRQFTDKQTVWERQLVRRGSDYFLPGGLKTFIEKRPEFVGTLVGSFKQGSFIPSVWLLQELAAYSDKYVVCNKKGEWLFICGRDLFEEGLVHVNVKEGIVLVLNQYKECLGYGVLRIGGRGERSVTNLWDLGAMMRRPKFKIENKKEKN